MSASLIAPEPRVSGSLRRRVAENLGATTVIFALLECWRPLYFLTDDNLDSGLPLLTGVGRRIVRGESPFVSDYLFGGHYNLLRDSSCLCWHPFYLLAAVLTQTPARFFVIDLVALLFLWLSAAGFVCLAHFLRRERSLPLGDARIMLCAQSFTFSMLILCTGASWLDFLANNSALPWLALGILQADWRRGLGLTTLFSAHQMLGGHPGATISNTLFLTLFALGIAYGRRSAVPLLSWCGGYALAILILSPLLIPIAEGFFASQRANGLTLQFMDRFAFPATLMPFSYLFGVFSSFTYIRFTFPYCQPWYTSAFLSCAAAWVIVPALLTRTRWRGLELLCLGLVAVAVLLVIRPGWLGEIMSCLPVLRSMRWPFREILQLLFFLHLILILRPLGGSPPFQRVTIFFGIFLFVCPFLFLSAPAFNGMDVDRQLLFSGAAERYWEKVKTQLKPGEVIAPVINPDLSYDDVRTAPYSLIAAFNYPDLFQVISGEGYFITVPNDQLYIHVYPMVDSALFIPSEEEAIRKQRPNIRFITLESVHPLRITLSSPTGPIDLTPFLAQP